MKNTRLILVMFLVMLASCGTDSSDSKDGDFDLTTCSGLCESGGFGDGSEDPLTDKTTCSCSEPEDDQAALDLGNCQEYCAAVYPDGAQTEIADDSESCTCHSDKQ